MHRYGTVLKDGVPVKSQFLVEAKFHPKAGPLGPLRPCNPSGERARITPEPPLMQIVN